jgi:hypothetical protein
METRKRSNAEFQQETDDRFAKYDALFERILGELQSLSTAVQTRRGPTCDGSSGSSSGSGPHGKPDHNPT